MDDDLFKGLNLSRPSDFMRGFEPPKMPDLDMTGMRESAERREAAELAMIQLAENSKQNWMQKHWIWWTVIVSLLSATMGWLFAVLLELQKSHHWLGL